MTEIKEWLWRENARAGEPIESPYIAILFSLGFALMSLILVLLDVKSSLYWGSGLAVLFFFMFVHFIWIWDKTNSLRIWAKLVIVVLIGTSYFWLIGNQVIFKYHEEHAAKQTLEDKIVGISRLRLHDFYLNDFAEFSISDKASLRIDGSQVTIEWKVYRNLAEGSTFFAYYIPSSGLLTSTQRTFDASKVLVTADQKALGIADSFPIKTVESGQDFSTKELVFTHRIYVYYEDLLSLDQINTLSNLYRQEGRSVIFRGEEYAEKERVERIAEATQKEGEIAK